MPGRLTSALALGTLAACGQEPGSDRGQRTHAPPIARIIPASEAIAGANIPTLDPFTMQAAEIEKVIGAGPRCEFRYTSGGRPVLALRREGERGPAAGVVKLDGSLVPLRSASGVAGGGPVMVADRVRLAVTPLSARPAEDDVGERAGQRRRWTADLRFEVGSELRVGYRGYYSCTG